MNRSIRIMLTGPSGVGKSTISSELILRKGFSQLRSHTTRARRPDESANAYYFVTPEVFRSTTMVETAQYQGNSYGLSMAALASTEGDIVHCASCDSFTNYHPLGFTSIMLLSPSEQELVRRLRQRDGRNDRVPIALEEHHKAPTLPYNACVVNDDLDEAVREILNIIDSLKSKIRNEEDH